MTKKEKKYLMGAAAVGGLLWWLMRDADAAEAKESAPKKKEAPKLLSGPGYVRQYCDHGKNVDAGYTLFAVFNQDRSKLLQCQKKNHKTGKISVTKKSDCAKYTPYDSFCGQEPEDAGFEWL